MDGQYAGEAIVGALVVIKQMADVVSARKRDTRQALAFTEFKLTLEERLAGFDRRIDKLFAFVIGPDGENGIRGDTRQLRQRVDDIEERERDRDRSGAPALPAHPMYDRRSAT